MATEPRAEAAAVEDSDAEEHRRFVELLQQGYEDIKAGRVVTAEEARKRVDAAIARGAERHARRGRQA
jgi:predicted transcriptional regulator